MYKLGEALNSYKDEYVVHRSGVHNMRPARLSRNCVYFVKLFLTEL